MTAHNPSETFSTQDGFVLPDRPREPEDERAPTALVTPQLLALARRISHTRQVRDQVFGTSLCINPPWHILVELFVASEEGRSVTIKSACVAAGVPQSTALRHIAHLIELGLCVRTQHPSDARSAHLKLTRRAHGLMVDFLRLLAEPTDPPRG